MLTLFEFAEPVTIKAKLACCCAVTESAFGLVHPESPGYKIGREALDACWEWLGGKNSTGNEIFQHFWQENEELGYYTGIVDHLPKSKENDPSMGGWDALGTLVLYLSWVLLKKEGVPDEYIPEEMGGGGEDLMNNFSTFIQETPSFHEMDFEALKRYLIATYPATEPDELGSPITKEEVLAYLPH
jgi:hypothetical protein